MKRSVIRVFVLCNLIVSPDCTSFHPGYIFLAPRYSSLATVLSLIFLVILAVNLHQDLIPEIKREM